MRFASTGSPAVSASSRAARSAEAASEAGFTLLEVLVALTVLALSLTVFYPAFTASVRGIATIDGHVAARQIAAGLIEEQGLGRTMTMGTTQGRDGPHRWRLSVGPSPEGLGPAATLGDWALFEITATVDWPPQHRFQLTVHRLGKRR